MIVFFMLAAMFFVGFMTLIVLLPPSVDNFDRIKTYDEWLQETKERIEKERHLKIVKKEEDGQANSKTNS